MAEAACRAHASNGAAKCTRKCAVSIVRQGAEAGCADETRGMENARKADSVKRRTARRLAGIESTAPMGVHGKRWAVVGLCLLAAAAVPGREPTEVLPPNAAIQAILKERVDSRRAAGIVVGILDGGGRRLVASGSGPAGAPLDGDTVFEIGSVTKVFTSSLLADMVRRGEVKLEDSISKYLPASVRLPSRNGKEITLLDLATQTSALPRLPGNLAPQDPQYPYAGYTVEQLYVFLSHYTLTRDIGEKYEYSNLGVGLLGHVLARKAGMSYEELVTKRILEPLGMKDTAITLSASMRARLAPGHDAGGAPVPTWDLPVLAGAGALRST